MSIDQPITVYPDDDNGASGGHTASEMRRVAEEWEKKHGKPGRVKESINLSEYLAGNKNKTSTDR